MRREVEAGEAAALTEHIFAKLFTKCSSSAPFLVLFQQLDKRKALCSDETREKLDFFASPIAGQSRQSYAFSAHTLSCSVQSDCILPSETEELSCAVVTAAS
jgi:hypothetical protein